VGLSFHLPKHLKGPYGLKGVLEVTKRRFSVWTMKDNLDDIRSSRRAKQSMLLHKPQSDIGDFFLFLLVNAIRRATIVLVLNQR
jgi:hypothetical protein